MAKAKNLEVSMSRRLKEERRANGGDRRVEQTEVAIERRAASQRRKVPRRRQIDPTTCERDYSDDEIQFMHALDEYKRANGRMFPTCSEILEVIRALGYVKAEPVATETPVDATVEADAPATEVVAVESTSSELVVASAE